MAEAATVAAVDVVCVVGAAAAAVTVAVLALTFGLTAAALTAVWAAGFEAALVASTRDGLSEGLVPALDFDADLPLALGLAAPGFPIPLTLSSVPSFGVVDEVPVWAPPVLLTTTPELTSVLDVVDPGVADGPDADDEPVVPAVPAAPVAPVVPVVPDAVPPAVPGVPPGELKDVDPPDELEELDVDEFADPPAVSATATPCPVATAVTSQAATARPPYPPTFAACRGEWWADTSGAAATNRGLTRELLLAMGFGSVAVGLMPIRLWAILL
ncbi:hypothetical protein SAMN04488580_11857 [Mycobacterium sp. 283mftsu]|nr:hypothetical protein SAMN04488580_11857 [Mycobacterium sp. 283mftsu]